MTEKEISELSDEALERLIVDKYGEEFTINDLDGGGEIENEFLKRLVGGFDG